jgi:hypothetical protein
MPGFRAGISFFEEKNNSSKKSLNLFFAEIVRKYLKN